jgi:membrane protein implicated in regulation of membrane protease activity
MFYACIALLVITALYTLLYSGLTGLLFCAALGLVLMGVLDSFQLVTAATVLVALLYTWVLRKYLIRFEPFEDKKEEKKGKEGFQDSSEQIIRRIGSLKASEPTGVYSSSVEGFEDVQPEVPKDGASSSGSSASADTKDQVDSKKVKEATSAHPEKEKEIEKEEFQSATNELFKLGKMPSEHAEGPKLDVGQTVMKAMNSLDPNTITSMTSDTKKLLETQKGLMSMLNQMRPVLADGKELLQTFSGMFGNGSQIKL